MNRKIFGAAALSLLLLAACNTQADVTVDGDASSSAAMMDDSSSAMSASSESSMSSVSSTAAMMEGEVDVEVDAQ